MALKDAYFSFVASITGKKEESAIDLDKLAQELIELPDSAEFFAETNPADAREQITALCLRKLSRLRLNVMNPLKTLIEELKDYKLNDENKDAVKKASDFLEKLSAILTGEKPFSEFEKATLTVNELKRNDDDEKQTEILKNYLKSQKKTIHELAGKILILKSKIETVTNIASQLITKH